MVLKLDVERKERAEVLGEKPLVRVWEDFDIASIGSSIWAKRAVAAEPHFPSTSITQPPPDPILDIRRQLRELAQRLEGRFAMKAAEPVRVEGESIKFNAAKMALGRFYLAELEGEPYLICKVSEDVVDVYGLAEQD